MSVRPLVGAMYRENGKDVTSCGRVLTVVGTAAACTIAWLVTRGVVVLPGLLVVQPASGLALPLTVLFGPGAALGAAIGALAGDVAVGSLAPISLVESGSQLLLGGLGWLYWRELDPFGAGRRPLGAAGRAGAAVAVSSAGAAAFLAWGSELLAVAPFHLAAVEAGGEYVLATLVVLAPYLVVSTRADGFGGRLRRPRAAPSPTGDRGPSPRTDGRRSRTVALLSLPVAWVLVGTIGSVGYRVLETIPPTDFVERGVGVLLVVHQPGLFGPGAVAVQAVFGSFVVAVFGALVVGGGRTASEGDRITGGDDE